MLLFINSIAGSEIVVILLFVLIFFGAKSIPGMARGLGKGIRQIKDASQDIQDEIKKTTGDMQRDMNVNRALHDARNTLEAPIKNFTNDLKGSASEVNKNINRIVSDQEGENLSRTFEAPISSFSKDLKDSASAVQKNIEGNKTSDLSAEKLKDNHKVDSKSDQENNS